MRRGLKWAISALVVAVLFGCIAALVELPYASKFASIIFFGTVTTMLIVGVKYLFFGGN